MPTIIDRRLNPAGKNFVNRQRFLRRAKEKIKETVKKSITSKQLRDVGKGEHVKIKSKDLGEPSFREEIGTGTHHRILNGNPGYETGDTISKPKKDKKGSQGSDGEDFFEDFEFTLSRDEFLDYLFEDLELPDFVKKSIKGAEAMKSLREGFTTSGSPANLNVLRTFKNAIGRRLALARPSDEYLEEVKAKILEAGPEEKKELEELLATLESRRKIVPFIDETDLKYNLWVQKPFPKNKAVMFCLMDVSGSMGETEKDISKRFFLLLYLFLERRYDTVDIRFIRHTTKAEEVDEKTFFYDTLSGGTAISSGLQMVCDLMENDYSGDEWNFYVAQCTDGDNWSADNSACEKILSQTLLPAVQYFAYIEVNQYERSGTIFEAFSAWPTYTGLEEKFQNLICRRIKHQRNVWTVFRELFST